MVNTALSADPAAVETFLAGHVRDAIHLVSIVPDGSAKARWFADDVVAATAWAIRRNAQGENIYWSVNRVRDGLNKKASKADMVAARFAHVDIDPPRGGTALDKVEALKRLAGGPCPPSFVLDSGNGVQAFWRLNAETDDLTGVEAVNVAIALCHAGDKCHNVDRVLRVPGTINYPTAKKVAEGRNPAPSHLMTSEEGRSRPLAVLAAHFLSTARQERDIGYSGVAPDAEDIVFVSADDLGLSPYHPLRVAIDLPAGEDRSRDVQACAHEMVRAGLSDAQMLGVLLNPANAVSEHCLSQGNSRRAARRSIARARNTASGETQAKAELLASADLRVWQNTSPEPKRFILPGFIPDGEVTLATAPGGSAKSTLFLQACICSAAGLPLLGLSLASGPAIFYTVEDDEREGHFRASHIVAQVGTSWEQLVGRLHYISRRGRLDNELATFDHNNSLKPTPAFGALRATIKATGSKLVILDNVAHVFSGNENERRSVTQFMNLLNQLCRDLDCAVVLIGHTPKSKADAYSGSTAWPNASRSMVNIKPPKEENDPFILEVGKANYVKAGKQLPFYWCNHALVGEKDAPMFVRAEQNAVRLQREDEAFLACLDELTNYGLPVSPKTSPNYAPARFESMPAARGLNRKCLALAMDRLLAAKAIEVYDHRNTSKGRTTKALRRLIRPTPDTGPDMPRTQSPDDPGQFSRTTPDDARTHSFSYGESKGGAFKAPRPYPEQERAPKPPPWEEPM